MRVLHLGNIAGNGYQNAKFQRRKGIESYVLSYDYRYCIGQPEWEDAAFDGVIVDPQHPDWTNVGVRDFERPAWFDDQTHIDSSSQLEAALNELVRRQRNPLRRVVYHLLDLVGGWPRRKDDSANLADRFNRLYHSADWAILHPEIRDVMRRCRDLYARRYSFLEDTLQPSDVLCYLRQRPTFKRHLRDYDVVQGYSTDSINTMLALDLRPFIAFDHGNMRDIPWEGTSRGRMLQLSYQAAFWCFLTNPDTVRSARRLRLERYSFMPHPVDETLFKPERSPLRADIQERYQCDSIIFAPARHNWELKGNDKMIRAFAQVCDEINGLLIFCDWGQEMERSRTLVEELSVGGRVVWLPPIGKVKLKDYYNASDVVLDQFTLGVFGSTAPEVMASGRPVVLAFDREIHEWCFEEVPPVIQASTADEIAFELRRLAKDRSLQAEIGALGRAWFLKWHSSEYVADRHIEMYHRLVEEKS